MMNSSADCNDDRFSPPTTAPHCRGGFDFTVFFEETMLSILPSTLFLIVGSVEATRMLWNRRLLLVNNKSRRMVLKLATIAVLAALQTALLACWKVYPIQATNIPVVSSALGLCVAVVLAITSAAAHRASPRPSLTITGFLLVSILLDMPRVRTTCLLDDSNKAVAGLMSASLAAKVVLLVLESIGKRSILAEAYARLSLEETSGLFSRGFFTWLIPLLRAGSRGALKLGDLFVIHQKLNSNAAFEQLQEALKKTDSSSKYWIIHATLRAWPWEVAKIVIPRLIVVACNLLQPFTIQAVVDNILSPDSPSIRNSSYGLIGAVGIIYVSLTIATGLFEQLTFRYLSLVRGGLIGSIYNHIETINTKAVTNSDSPIMTLIGADVERICEMWKFIITDTWASILQLGIGIWLLQKQLGAVCIAPVVFAVLSTAISLRAGTYVGKRQKVWLEAVQKRVNFTSHALSNMKSIKMLGYSDGIHDFIQALRVGELDRAKHYRKLSSLNVCLTNLPNTVAPLITFATYAIANKLQGQDDFTMSKAIASLAILQVIMYPLGSLLYSVPQCFSAVACFQRIQTFLNEKPIEDDRLFGTSTLEKKSETSPAEPTDSIILRNATIGWSAPVVHDISFKVSRDSSLVAIVGPVACGKSTIINALVGEARIFSGSVWMASKEVSVCQQSAWLSSGTIREQVIGDYGFSESWYNEVIRACALHTDLELMSDGDQTDVGAQGVGLSGGQRQRIAIARAIYSRKPIAIFDDVLSALDATTQESIIENVFGPTGLMRKMGTTLVLATHSARCLSVMDRVITINSEGRITDNSISGSGSDTPKSTNHAEPEPANGVDASIVQTQIRSAQDAAQADRSIGDLEVYKYYFSSLGVVGLSMFGLFVCAYAAFGSVQQAWLKLWAESDSSSNTGYWLGLYALWTLLRSSGLVIAVIFLWIIITPKSGTRLHQAVLKAAFKAPMSFHSQTDTGTLVNRFSQDMQLADIVLPVALITTSFQLSGCIGYGILTFVATPYFAAFVPFVVGLLALLQRFYLRTSKQIRLIELESKAPLYSHMIDTINGVVSIRAFGWFASYKDKYFSLLDDCQKPFYLLLCIQRWLAVMLGLIVAVLATSLTAMAVGLRGTNVSAGFIGIALVNMMGLGEILASLIMFWTSLETSLGAVSRVKTFSEDTPTEPEPTGTASAEWPRSGDIQITNLTASHADFVALKDLTIDIKSGEKIAICGRTGSGKSSLITAMLGMMDIQSGSIALDGQDLSQIANEVVRNRITCITQDPYLFSASVRLNMDLHGISNDEDIQTALVRVGLWSVLQESLGEELSAAKVLDASMDDIHLSHGQRQLICLARALLRKTQVVLLDEPTSSVDAATEAKMTEIIDSEFPGATILMITHRLTSIHSFDKVMVLDAGKLVEFGAPATLLADEASVFSQLYKSQTA